MKRKIALLGGTFDPVHYGHLQLAEWIKKRLQLDSIFFIPIHSHPFSKRKDITPAEHRLNMLQLAVSSYDNFEVSTVELERGGVSYTVDTLRFFHERLPETEFYFLLGDDNLAEFRKWKEPDEIRRLAKIVVFRRGALRESNKKKYPDFIFVNNPLIRISSSEIRQRLRNGKAVNDFLPPSVHAYIERHGLYGIRPNQKRNAPSKPQ